MCDSVNQTCMDKLKPVIFPDCNRIPALYTRIGVSHSPAPQLPTVPSQSEKTHLLLLCFTGTTAADMKPRPLLPSFVYIYVHN